MGYGFMSSSRGVAFFCQLFKQVLLLLVIGSLVACSTKPHVVESSTGQAPWSATAEVFVVGHGWHTGLVVPAAALQWQLPQLWQRFPQASHLEVGWGDAGFYQAEEVTSGLTMQAIFWPSRSVVHVVAVPSQVQRYFPASQVERLCLDARAMAALLQFMVNSFASDADGKLIPLKKGIYGNSQFYQGQGDYYLFNTCNKWTAKGLKSAGFAISPWWKLRADSVMDYLVKENRSCTTALP